MEKQIRKLFIAQFLGNLYFYLPVGTLFLLGNGVTLQTILFANMMYSVVTFLAEVPTGVLADRLGHQKAVALGFLADAISLLIIALAPTPEIVILSAGIRGIAGAFLSGSREALLYEYGKSGGRSYKRDFSHLMSYEVLGFASGALLAGIIVQMFGESSYAPAFFMSFAAVFIASLLALSLTPHRIHREVGQSRLHEVRESLRLFKSVRMLRILFIVVGLTYSGRYIILDLYQPHMEAHDVLPFFLGSALTLGSLAHYFIIRNAYKIEKFLGARLSLAVLAGLTALAYIMFGLFTSPYMLVVSFVLLFGVADTVNVFVSDYANQHATSGVRATVLSGISFGREVSKAGFKALFAVAVGIMALADVFVAFGIFLLAGAAISYVLLKKDTVIASDSSLESA